MTIKVLLETQCAGCRATLEAVQHAAAAIDSAIEVLAITDVKQILAYKVWRMPTVVIDENVVSVGKNLNEKQAELLIKSTL